MSACPLPPPLWTGWVCPHCGQTEQRHGRGGARGCHAEGDERCPGLECKCTDGKCYSKAFGFGWRRSPCPNAECAHCGWKGTLRSREFERHYGASRCPGSSSGWHWVTVRVEMSQFEPAGVMLVFTCRDCGATGTSVIDPIKQITWTHASTEEKP